MARRLRRRQDAALPITLLRFSRLPSFIGSFFSSFTPFSFFFFSLLAAFTEETYINSAVVFCIPRSIFSFNSSNQLLLDLKASLRLQYNKTKKQILKLINLQSFPIGRFFNLTFKFVSFLWFYYYYIFYCIHSALVCDLPIQVLSFLL